MADAPLLSMADREKLHGDDVGDDAEQIIPSQCALCVHYRKRHRCLAFGPRARVPDRILANEYDHRNPFPGDHGVRWAPAKPGIKHPMDRV